MAPQSCARGSSGNGRAGALQDGRLEDADELLEVVGGQLRVDPDAAVLLHLLEGRLEEVRLVLVLRLAAHDDVAVHGHEAAVAVVGEARVLVCAMTPCTVVSLSPRLRMVSIMPGMLARAPERTLMSSGLAAIAEALAGVASPGRQAPRRPVL